MAVYTLNEVEQDIGKILVALEKARHDPQFALECANALSTLMFNLAPLYIEAQEQMNLAERKYKDLMDDTMMDMRVSSDKAVAEIEAIGRKKGRALYQEYLSKQSLASKVKMLREDCDRRISLLQSWASELRSQKTFRAPLTP